MQETELRIGNLVKGSPEIVIEIVSVNKHSCGYIIYRQGSASKDFINGKIEIKKINPIPITEEILLKCGFEKKTMLHDFYFENKYYKLHEVIPKEGYYLSDNDVRKLKPCKYLHELQNLQKSLTGNELTINL